MHLKFVVDAILHLGQEARLILGTSCERLGRYVTELQATAWISREGEDQVTCAASNSLGWIIQRHNIIFYHGQEPIFILVVQFRFLRLNLSQIMLNGPRSDI